MLKSELVLISDSIEAMPIIWDFGSQWACEIRKYMLTIVNNIEVIHDNYTQCERYMIHCVVL